MPYSDNLYSGHDFGDSDSDDYGDQLSPSDGYFTATTSSHGVPSVPNIMVPDPTLRQQPETTAESKAREAEEDHVAAGAATGALNTRRRGDPLGNASLPSDYSYSHLHHATAPSTRTQSTYPIFTPRTPLSTSAYTPSTSSASPSVAAAATTTTTPRRPLRSLTSPRGRSASVYSDAPPAYTPSSTSPLSPTSPINQARNYSTITHAANMGIEDQRLLSRDPESMGSPNDEESVRPAWRQRVRRRLPAWVTWRTTLLASVLLIASMGFLASSYRVVKDDKSNTIRPSPAVPIKQPADQAPLDPPPPGGPPHPDLPVLQPLESTHCKNATFRFPEQIMAVKFSKEKYFSFVEEMALHKGHADVSIAGQVNIRKVDATGDPRVILEIVTNDPDLRVDVNADEADQMMKVTVPKHTESADPDMRPCMEMRATIYVPENAELKEMGIKTVHLDILTLDDLSLKVAEYTRFVSDLGNIISAAEKARTYTASEMTPLTGAKDYIFVPAKNTYQFNSRVIEVQTVAGSIGGTWPLYDLLGLHATAGNIQASIAPKPVLEVDPKPAVLSLSTVSGFLSAAEPIHELDQMPIREYLVDLKSTSGRIHGALAFSTGIDLKSTASDIAVDLLPVLDSSKVNATHPAQLETGTTSGTTAVRVLDPVWFAGWSASPPSPPASNKPPPTPLSRAAAAAAATKRDANAAAPITLTAMATLEQVKDVSSAAGLATQPLNCLSGVHKSTSGDIGLKYPSTWVGNLVGESTAGRLGVTGKDVFIVKSTSGLGRSELIAYKGQNGGASSIQTRSMIGNLACQIGQ